jgi:mono/diheme cytochrome c family protein
MRKPGALIGVASIMFSAAASAQVTRTDEPRGELLYSTYCVSCHTTQVHWRTNKLAIDWTSLKYQVRRWQANVGIGLGEDDVAAVARYLNRIYYHFPPEERSKPKA